MWVNKALSDDFTVNNWIDNRLLSKINFFFRELRPRLIYNSLAKTI